MIRRSEEKQSVRKPAPFNGVGEITVRSLLNGPEGPRVWPHHRPPRQ